MSSAFVEPVLVFTLARSKSSWVAATVVDTLDAWAGSCSGVRPGYPRGQLENRRLVELQRAWFGRGWDEADAGRACHPVAGFRAAVIETIERDGYPGGPWVFKCSAWYAPAWIDAFPDASLITVRRDPAQAVASARRHKGSVPSPRNIAAHMEELDRLRDDHGAFEVNPDTDPDDLQRLQSWLEENRCAA